MVLFSLGNYSSSIKQFSKTKFLSINILSSKQKKLSDNFALTAPNLEDIKFIEGKNKTVIIPNCIANLECELVDKIKKEYWKIRKNMERKNRKRKKNKEGYNNIFKRL